MDRSSLCENLLLHCPPSPYESLIKSQPESSSPQQWGSHAENPLVQREKKNTTTTRFLYLFHPSPAFVGILPCNSCTNPHPLTLTPQSSPGNFLTHTWSWGKAVGGGRPAQRQKKHSDTPVYLPEFSSASVVQYCRKTFRQYPCFNFPSSCQTAGKIFP